MLIGTCYTRIWRRDYQRRRGLACTKKFGNAWKLVHAILGYGGEIDKD